jgi:DNA-binding MarR family transcriptional regulator
VATRAPSKTTERLARKQRAGGEAPAAWVEFLRAHAEITRELDISLRHSHGLSVNEYEVLLQLWLADESRMRRVDLAEHLLITQGGMTRLLAGLERQGLVERAPCPDDARVAYAQLTREGRRRLEAARRDHLTDVRRLFADRFSPRELELLGRLLGRLSAG